MNFKIDRQFGNRIVDLTWVEVKHGIAKGWIDCGVAVDKAVEALQSDTYTEDETELAGLDFSDTFAIEDKVHALAQPSAEVDTVRWAKIALAWLYENKENLENPLMAIEELYADFDYPEEIAHLVGYMPHEGEPKDLMVEWELFLNSEVYSKLLQKVQNTE